MKILAAIDGSGCSEAVVDEIILRPWPKDSEVKVVTAVELTAPVTADSWALDPSYLDQMDNLAVRQAEAVMDRAMGRLEYRPHPNVKISKEIFRGSPREVILSEAEQWKADLVLVGSHGRHGLKRLWLGSVSQAVASHAPCSVEIVRCPKSTETSHKLVTPMDDQC